MKKIVLVLSVFAVLATGATLAQELPQPSPLAKSTQTVGVTDISLEYSRPGVKGRTIWGELVPYGKMWRVGANASTKIEFSSDVTINNVLVKAGKYSLFVIPEKEWWTFVINTYTDGWGTGDYDEKNDVVRIQAAPIKNSHTENMLIVLDELTVNSAMCYVIWEEVKVGFKIDINTDKFVTENIEKMLKEADNSFRAYNSVATWYLLHDGDKAKALELAKKSVAQDKRFWNLTVLAEAYAANEDKKMAIKTAKEALEMAEAAKYQSYIDRNKKNIEAWGK